jgi:acetylornithine deacetylase
VDEGPAAEDRSPTLVLCAHLDTVGTAGMTHPPFEPHIEDGRLYGRGAYDMKGGAAAVMLAAAALAEEDFPGRVVLALVADEEYRSIGAEAWVTAHGGDACIVTEPTEGRLVLAHKGFLWARVWTEGIAAHGSRWDLGLSAIGRMGPIIARLESFDRLELRERVHPMVGPASMHPALVEGGVGLSTYAPHCMLEVERRTLPGEARLEVERELRSVVDDAGEPAQVECHFWRDPLETASDTSVARCVRAAAEGVTGTAPQEVGVGYWTDAAIFASAGMPSLLYGPGGAGAHAAEEWVDLASVLGCARVVADAARRFCTD